MTQDVVDVDGMIALIRQFIAGELEHTVSDEKYKYSANRPQFAGKPFVHCEKLELAANMVFIDKGGGADWTAILKVQDALPSVKIAPLESDSFGWLVGGIFTEKGIVSFG